GRAVRDGARVVDAEPSRKRPLELPEPRTERQPAGAQHLQHQFLLALADDRLGERDRLGHGRAAGSPVPRRAWWLRLGSIPASSESTSASQLASMMFSDTPIEPHVSVPSVASSSTRVTAPVPLRSSRMATL